MELRFHPCRRWQFELAWLGARLAAEVEGGIWSRGRRVRGAGYERDCEKLNAGALLSWSVLKSTAEIVKDAKAVEAIRRAFELTHAVREG